MISLTQYPCQGSVVYESSGLKPQKSLILMEEFIQSGFNLFIPHNFIYHVFKWNVQGSVKEKCQKSNVFFLRII